MRYIYIAFLKTNFSNNSINQDIIIHFILVSKNRINYLFNFGDSCIVKLEYITYYKFNIL